MRKWTIGILAILLCAGLSGCAASEEVPPEAGGPITDLAGEVLGLSGSFYYGQYGEVYGRVTSGFYTDNRTEPAAFTAGGDYVGDWKLSDVAVKKYKADAAIGSFRLSSGGTFSLQEASTERGAASPVYQAVRLDDVRLTGVLRLVETTSNTGNFMRKTSLPAICFSTHIRIPSGRSLLSTVTRWDTIPKPQLGRELILPLLRILCASILGISIGIPCRWRRVRRRTFSLYLRKAIL